MKDFAEWLAATGPSVFIKTHQAWIIPSIQSIHILGIGIVIGSVFLIALRVLGVAAMDQTMKQVNRRFAPWLAYALGVLAVTGVLMIIGEPARELVSFSFWAKMSFLAVGVAVAVLFTRAVARHEDGWDEALTRKAGVRAAAIGTIAVWLCVIVLGRLIAYDHIWGALSPAAQY